jgi:hypothetical protein
MLLFLFLFVFLPFKFVSFFPPSPFQKKPLLCSYVYVSNERETHTTHTHEIGTQFEEVVVVAFHFWALLRGRERGSCPPPFSVVPLLLLNNCCYANNKNTHMRRKPQKKTTTRRMHDSSRRVQFVWGGGFFGV